MDNTTLGNINVTVDLTKLPGARVMDITRGETTHRCVVIPIDNEMGMVCDAYEAKLPDGMTTMKPYADIKLFMVGIAHREMRYGMSHGLKPAFNTKHIADMTEDQMRAVAWCGNVKPWLVPSKKKEGQETVQEKKYKNW